MALETIYETNTAGDPHSDDRTIADGAIENVVLHGDHGSNVAVQAKVGTDEYETIRRLNSTLPGRSDCTVPGPIVYRIKDLNFGIQCKVIAYTA